ncbi:MAG: NAD(P)/FAD-dependent oxidoreductase [Tepidisphaeraceae bacterium]
MNSRHVKYLLVGGGLAGSSAAEAIRRLDPHGSVLLVGQEISRPYHRPPLSKEYLRRKASRADLITLPIDWFREHDVELRTGWRVSYLDVNRAAVVIDNGEEVSYDRLLLAIGGAPRPLQIPGERLPNVHYLRTVEDADRIHHAVDKARTEGRQHDHGRGRAVVIGGELLGVEVAAALAPAGIAVDLVVSGAHPWAKFAGENTGRFIARFLETQRVNLHTSARALSLDGDGRAQHVSLSTGQTLDCDFVIAASGMVVNREILRDTPIAAENAILTDERCLTSVPNIYAAGDCAAVFDPLFGKHRHLDHWDNARATGDIAGSNMAGGDERYSIVNNFFSDVLSLSMSAWGEAKQVDRRLWRGAPNADAPGFVEIGIAADGRVAQVVRVGKVDDQDSLLSRLVERRLQADGLEDHLRDPTRPLSALLG